MRVRSKAKRRVPPITTVSPFSAPAAPAILRTRTMIVVMPRKLLIVIANTDPRNHEELESPFFRRPSRRRWILRSRSSVPPQRGT
jgi:hypothetical protein